MNIDWYTTKSLLEPWQELTERLLQQHKIAWHDHPESAPNAVADDWRIFIVDLVESYVEPYKTDSGKETAKSMTRSYRQIRLAVLPQMDLSEILYPHSGSHAPLGDSTPPLITKLKKKIEAFDGVITVTEDQAELIRDTLLRPAIAIRIPHLIPNLIDRSPEEKLINKLGNWNKKEFARKFNELLDQVLQWQLIAQLWDRVGEELAYLGASADTPTIDVVSQAIATLAPQVELP